VKKHQALLYPAFEIQKIIRKKCLGKRFWVNYSKRRIELSKGNYMTMKQINELINRNAIHHHLRHIDDPLKHDIEHLIDVKGSHAKRKGSKTDTVRLFQEQVEHSGTFSRRGSRTSNSVVPMTFELEPQMRYGPVEYEGQGPKPIITTSIPGQNNNSVSKYIPLVDDAGANSTTSKTTSNDGKNKTTRNDGKSLRQRRVTFGDPTDIEILRLKNEARGLYKPKRNKNVLSLDKENIKTEQKIGNMISICDRRRRHSCA
jgi:hypothetical protein